ncbi:probable palmitoyltransferase ZDHHC24 [Anabrus simplex]|uniref:probable palmitoyltransferase ZDHHC24 n=1 Tax=Anabrus simplex TaxID=316456 RepID=UPI0035A30D59
MKIRKRFLPRTPADCGAFFFVLFMVPSTYWFELFIVLPAMYTPMSFWYIIHFICGTFIMVNITSNFLAIVLADSSINGELMPSTIEPNNRFCSVCETIAPPRSWHCDVCKTCILKRDHHCMFTGCCIGHFNHRYFIVFVLYVFLGALYSSYFNCFFVWNILDFTSPLTLLKFVFPLAMIIFDLDASEKQCYLLLFIINLLATVFTGALLWFHGDLVLKGIVTYEKNHHIADYDLGKKENIKVVFGKRWYIAWLFPFIVSELPHDGIKWTPNNLIRTEGIKNR